MKFRYALALVVFLSFGAHGKKAVDNNDHLSVTAPPQPIVTTTEDSNITTTPIPTTKTPATTTPSTPAPTTKPTTPVPTTPTTPAPTTAKPTTPSTPAPTTPPTTTAPITTHAPAAEGWFVKDASSGVVCIIAKMGINVVVPYHSSNNKTQKAEFKIEYNDKISATGTCGNQTQTLILDWGNGTATFEFSHGNETYSLQRVAVVIDVNNNTFPNNAMTNVTRISFGHDVKVFSVAMNHSYTCASVDPLKLNGTAYNQSVAINGTIPGTLTLSDVHAEAFGTEKEVKYSGALDCASKETPDMVPIIVGLILAGLVVVVLIAYLVGRRRAQARGYLSM